MDSITANAKIKIHRPPSEVFAAFVDADVMSKFWFSRRDDGLREGEFCTWFIGSGKDATSFEVRVVELSRPNRIVIEWESGGASSQVTWSMEETEAGETVLAIEESGFTGSSEAIIRRALDSTGGFNQVVVAAKATIEHGIELNVVADHV